MADGRGDGPFSAPGKLETLFGELGPEPVELLLAVESIDMKIAVKTNTVNEGISCLCYF